VRLPSEAEWEKAARGGLKIPATAVVRPISRIAEIPDIAVADNPRPQRRYPWTAAEDGDRMDPNWGSYRETDIQATSSVVCFPDGESVYGCHEMSGNVFEWTDTRWQAYPYAEGRALIGSPSKRAAVVTRGAITAAMKGGRAAQPGTVAIRITLPALLGFGLLSCPKRLQTGVHKIPESLIAGMIISMYRMLLIILSCHSCGRPRAPQLLGLGKSGSSIFHL
jgi:hypothetical protein